MAVRSKIPAIRAGLQAAAARGVQRAGGMVADLAQQLCPVDTGALRASIRLEPAAPALQMAVKAGGGRVDYARYVEYGVSNSPAQPFLTPAARAIDVQQEVGKEVADFLRKA